MLELLAPAGSMEALRAAVQNGANAVYLGCGQFNARQSAKNFTPQTLIEAVKYCHARDVKVYVTMNTLVTDKEIHDVINEIKYRNDIESTISQYVNLQRRGKNLVGLCPFHSEKTPSFTVYPENGSFYCFGCGC